MNTYRKHYYIANQTEPSEAQTVIQCNCKQATLRSYEKQQHGFRDQRSWWL